MSRAKIILSILAVVALGGVACDSPTSISQKSINEIEIDTPEETCDDVTTELINGVCVAIECDEGFELDTVGECVESDEEPE